MVTTAPTAAGSVAAALLKDVDLRPLASSLAPLPGEALNGFLLRMAYRLDLPPARIGELTGLIPPGAERAVLPFSLMMDLAPDQRAHLARTTRLTTSEVSGLCLSSFADRYRPALPRTPGTGWSGAIGTGQTRWIHDRIIRWCPQCLAGDRSPIQFLLGGAWQKSWRLAVVFGCPSHRRLLEHLCPRCDRPLGRPRPRVLAIPDAHYTGIHPAHCRLPAPTTGPRRPPPCGGPLATPPATRSTRLTGRQLALQRRVLALLDPAQPGETLSVTLPATAAQYFTDLQLLANLIRASWPRIRSLTDVPAPLARLAALDRTRAAATGVMARNLYEDPPLEAALSAALLTVADHLLTLDPRDLSEHILHLRNHDPRRTTLNPWTRDFLTNRPDCSPGFYKAVTPALHGYTRRDGSRRRRSLRNPLYPTGYGARHIAQFLQDDWYEDFFGHLDGINPLHLRRTAAIYLCQLAVGGSAAKAAALLGLPAHRAHLSSKLVQDWASTRTDPRAFETAAHTLADHLGRTASSDQLINYERRRQALRDWCIGPATWTDIRTQLGPYHPRTRGVQLGDRRRQTASMIVWVRVTQGEHTFAPHPIRDQQPPKTQFAWSHSDNTAWARIQHRRLGHLETDLYRILYTYADDLAAQIDAGDPPTIR